MNLDIIDESTIRLARKKTNWRKVGKIAGGLAVAAAAGALGYYGAKRQIGVLKKIATKKDYIEMYKKLPKQKITRIGRLKKAIPYAGIGAGAGAGYLGAFGMPVIVGGSGLGATDILHGFYRQRRDELRKSGKKESRWKSAKHALTPLPALRTKVKRVRRRAK